MANMNQKTYRNQKTIAKKWGEKSEERLQSNELKKPEN
jgi:hypothetical protein